MKIIYELSIKVPKEIEKDFHVWETRHIHKLLKVDGFERASWFVVTDPATPDFSQWSIHYLIRDQTALEKYLKNQATEYRKEFQDSYGDRVEITRRILESHQVIE